MIKIRQIFLLTIALKSTILFGQLPKNIFSSYGIENYNSKDFSSNKISISKRVGSYHFGESESEWDLVIQRNNDSLIVQVWKGAWGVDLGIKKDGWYRICETFNQVKQIGNKFFFGKYIGLFAEYNKSDKQLNSVLLLSSPTNTIDRKYGKDSAEVGFQNSNLDTHYRDFDFPELSLKIQDENYFKNKTKQELKIMRNSVYAKYGQYFQEGGEMNKYFKTKEWYKPFQKKSINCLTEIEKRNVQIIAKLEQL